jgi:branched-chain amino acid transport system permease protein
MRFSPMASSPYLIVSYAQTNRILPEPYQRVIVAILAVALVCIPLFSGDYFVHLLNLCLIAVIGAVGLNLLTGYCGQLSLGHASFMAIGAFATAILAQRYGMHFIVVIPASCCAGAAVGLAVGLPALRFRGIYLAITTLATHYAIIYVLTNYEAILGPSASAGITIPPLSLADHALTTERGWFYALLVVDAAVVMLGLNLARSHVGRAWVAIRDRDIAAEACGIDVPRYKLLAFTISATLAALAGSLGAYFTTVVTVEEYTLELAIIYLAMIIVGGMGSVTGSVLGAVSITLLPYGVERIFAALPWSLGTVTFGVQEATIGAAIIGFLLFEPDGLIEIYRRTATYFERWPFRYREIKASGAR